MSKDADVTKPLKTWSHLAGNRRRPTEYEVVSTKLLWNTPNHTVPWRMAGATPQIQWIIENRNRSKIQHPDWDAFRDPDRLVYRTYSLMQDGQESYVDGLLDDFNRNEHDATLDPAWLDILANVYTPGRYLFHATQMASAYLVALAPCSTVANALMFQVGDQLRWVSRIAYRTVELSGAHSKYGFGTDERQKWEKGLAWRGFLELAERTLVAWDWGECFTALNLVMKPAIDEAFLRQLGREARGRGDALTGALMDAQLTDSDRSRRLTAALTMFLVDGNRDNKLVIDTWLGKWVPLAERAVDAFCRPFDDSGSAAREAKAKACTFRREIGLSH